jgi:Tfp pilus assembly protein PilX
VKRSRGAALVVSLVLLGVLMLMGITAVMLSNTQSRVAGNLQYRSLAAADAESAMAQAESWLNANWAHAGFSSPGVPGLYPPGATVDPLRLAWNDATSIKADANGNQRYTIELYMPSRPIPENSTKNCTYGTTAACPVVNVYRVTARGANQLGATAYLQSLYSVRVK